MFSKVILIGRLVGDPELRYTQSGKAVANFRLAVDRGVAGPDGKRQADYFDVVTWNKLAETCANHLGKGRLVAVDGRLQNDSYVGKDGQKRWTTKVIAHEVRFLDGKPRAGGAKQGAADVEPPAWNGAQEGDHEDPPF